MRFIKAFAWWIFGGELLSTIMVQVRYLTCQYCDRRRSGSFRDYCNVCWCTVSPKRHPFNKCAYPCEECPLGYWSKVGGYGCEVKEVHEESTEDRR